MYVGTCAVSYVLAARAIQGARGGLDAEVGGTSEVHRPQLASERSSAHPQAGPSRSPPPPPTHTYGAD
jgi:hypothetical protein